MSEQAIREYAQTKGFHPRTTERWLSWPRADGDALLQLVSALKLGENHVRDLLEWLEEIGLRDGIPAREVLQKDEITEIQSDPRLGRGDRLKRVKEQVRRLRFPRLSRLEDAVHAKIRELRLHPHIKLSVPPGLEGAVLRVEFAAKGRDELDSLVVKLGAAAKSESMAEIFALLRGDLDGEDDNVANQPLEFRP